MLREGEMSFGWDNYTVSGARYGLNAPFDALDNLKTPDLYCARIRRRTLTELTSLSTNWFPSDVVFCPCLIRTIN